MVDKVINTYIIEDYHIIRTGLVSVLSEYPQINFVGQVGSAEEGLEDLPNKQVDVLILDLGLPGMNGIEMATKVKERWPETKIVILTSHNQSDEILASFAAGVHAYALKDIVPARLLQVIETVYDGAIWIDPAIASVVMNLLVTGARPALSKVGGGADDGMTGDLTEREKVVLQGIVDGKNNQEIAEELHISFHTVKAHVSSILGKLSVNDRVQAAVKALKQNLV